MNRKKATLPKENGLRITRFLKDKSSGSVLLCMTKISEASQVTYLEERASVNLKTEANISFTKGYIKSRGMKPW